MPALPHLKQRNSSVELYRIIATLTVLIVHFNGWFVGGMPEKFDFSNPSVFRTGQMIIEAATCICVNMFLIISGYFGIKLKLQSVVRICLLLVSIYVPFYFWDSLLSHNFKITGFISQFFVISRAGYFIQCYMMLMFLSPVLNAFIEKYDSRIVLKWTMLFWLIEFWFGCVHVNENFGFNHGYSIIHFVLIYMLARCVYLYKELLLKQPTYFWLTGYMLSTILICVMYIIGFECAFDYSNPIVVFSAICTFVPFLYKSYYIPLINWIAGGTLAVYIIHCTNPVHRYLAECDYYLLVHSFYSSYLMYVGTLILFTFLCSSLYGIIANKIINYIFKSVHSKVNG